MVDNSTLGGILKQSFDATLAWEHPTPERLKLNACLFFAAFLCSLGVGLSSSLKARVFFKLTVVVDLRRTADH